MLFSSFSLRAPPKKKSIKLVATNSGRKNLFNEKNRLSCWWCELGMKTKQTKARITLNRRLTRTIDKRKLN